MNCSGFLLQALLALLCGLAFSPLVIAAALTYHLVVMAREVAHGREMEALRIKTDLEVEMFRHELTEPERPVTEPVPEHPKEVASASTPTP